MEKVKGSKQKAYWWRGDGQVKSDCAAAPRAGDRCPVCEAAELAYDGLFILSCPACGHVAANGAFT
jgi:ribosomal protein L37AE/L43A